MTIKAVIFDLDGTITSPFFDFDLIRKEMGFKKNSGPVWEQMLETSPEKRKSAEKILNRHEKLAIENSVLNEGVAETLDTLKKQGIFSAVLTRNTKSIKVVEIINIGTNNTLIFALKILILGKRNLAIFTFPNSISLDNLFQEDTQKKPVLSF